MKRLVKYAALIFAMVLATSIIGGCLTAGVTVVQMLVEKAGLQNGGEGGLENANRNNGLWYEEEDGDIVFMGIHFGSNNDVKSGVVEFKTEEVRSLDIEGLSNELVMEPWEKEYISVAYENVAEEYEFSNDDGVLKIRCDRDWGIFGTSVVKPSKILVQVPEGKVFKNVTVDMGSGSMKMTQMEAESVTVDSGSGSVKISELVSDKLYVDSGSGSVNISESSMEEGKVNVGSGSINLKSVTSKKTILESGSGSVTVKESKLNETSADTGSGGINFEEVIAEDLVVESGSGRVNFLGELVGNCVFDTSSGSVNLEIYGKEEDYNIRADLGSGGMYINGEKEKDTEIKHSGADNLLVFDAGSGRVSIEFLGSREAEQAAGTDRAGK